jgi:hypothetical protein
MNETKALQQKTKEKMESDDINFGTVQIKRFREN